jgi:hypothetical protein
MEAMKVLVAGVAVLAAAQPGAAVLEKWGPTWSEVTGNKYSTTVMNREAAVISTIDGRTETARIVKTAPGKHAIVVRSPMRKGFAGTDVALEMNLEACKRYYINAQFTSGVGKDWEPVIDHVEPIAGCRVEGAAKR